MEAEIGYCVVVTTTANREDAEMLARHLLAERLAACVQISTIDSFYVWKGEIAREGETLLQVKTRADLYGKVESAIRSRHQYEVPEILALPVLAGSAPYLRWIDESTAGSE